MTFNWEDAENQCMHELYFQKCFYVFAFTKNSNKANLKTENYCILPAGKVEL